MLFNIKDFTKYSPIYIETGTCFGDSLQRALNSGFVKCKSVEAYDKFYQKCLVRFSGNPLTQLYFGLSNEQLPEMLKDVDQPAVIFLDAHPAGPGTAGHDDLMNNGNQSEYQQNTILTKEIEAILAHRNDHIIIIDDQAGPDEHNLKFMHRLLAANTNYEFEFFDEQLEGQSVVKDKILVCIPKLA
jgi:hypothetical protein